MTLQQLQQQVLTELRTRREERDRRELRDQELALARSRAYSRGHARYLVRQALLRGAPTGAQPLGTD